MIQDHFKLLEQIIRQSNFHMRCLETVRTLALPDWAIGAGFVRNAAWDQMHGYSEPTPLTDVDVLYFDPTDISRSNENELEGQLTHLLPSIPWEVRNQARMHEFKGEPPFLSTEDALKHWLETPTCVAVRLNGDDTMEFLAPFGVDDLIKMFGRPTPAGRKYYQQYQERMRSKNWPSTWPKVMVEL